jgi:hypothetical protein
MSKEKDKRVLEGFPSLNSRTRRKCSLSVLILLFLAPGVAFSQEKEAQKPIEGFKQDYASRYGVQQPDPNRNCAAKVAEWQRWAAQNKLVFDAMEAENRRLQSVEADAQNRLGRGMTLGFCIALTMCGLCWLVRPRLSQNSAEPGMIAVQSDVGLLPKRRRRWVPKTTRGKQLTFLIPAALWCTFWCLYFANSDVMEDPLKAAISALLCSSPALILSVLVFWFFKANHDSFEGPAQMDRAPGVVWGQDISEDKRMDLTWQRRQQEWVAATEAEAAGMKPIPKPDVWIGKRTLPPAAVTMPAILLDTRRTIYLFENANVSTVVHEFFHVARPFINRGDMGILERWAHEEVERKNPGMVTKNLDGTINHDVHLGTWTGKLGVQKEEVLARAFENYIATAEAPNSAIRAAFEKIKEALRSIYALFSKDAGVPREIDVQIGPAVRPVFDRWFGS